MHSDERVPFRKVPHCQNAIRRPNSHRRKPTHKMPSCRVGESKRERDGGRDRGEREHRDSKREGETVTEDKGETDRGKERHRDFGLSDPILDSHFLLKSQVPQAPGRPIWWVLSVDTEHVFFVQHVDPSLSRTWLPSGPHQSMLNTHCVQSID